MYECEIRMLNWAQQITPVGAIALTQQAMVMVSRAITEVTNSSKSSRPMLQVMVTRLLLMDSSRALPSRPMCSKVMVMLILLSSRVISKAMVCRDLLIANLKQHILQL
jgi:hypothetical protein